MNLLSMLQEKQLLVPCIYDCLSAQMAEKLGFAAALLSGGGLSYSLLGMPDLAMLTIDDLVEATERITAATHIPLIIDADDGYGESPAVVYRAVRRLVRAGAQAVTIDDSTGIRGFERCIYGDAHPKKALTATKLLNKRSGWQKLQPPQKPAAGATVLSLPELRHSPNTDLPR